MLAPEHSAATAHSGEARQPVPISADGSRQQFEAHSAEHAAAPAGTDACASLAFSSLHSEAEQKDKQLFRDFYEVASVASSIVEGGFVCVALQFPDELLGDAVLVMRELKNDIAQLQGQKNKNNEAQTQPSPAAPAPSHAVNLFLLADTSFGSCCVDEVAAQHVSADLLVHYGFTCLSQTRRLPVRFVFGKGKIHSLNNLVNSVLDETKWQQSVQPPFDHSSSSHSSATASQPPPIPLLILYSLEYHHYVASGELAHVIQQKLQSLQHSPVKFIVSIGQVQTQRSTHSGLQTADAQGCQPSQASCACSSSSAILLPSPSPTTSSASSVPASIASLSISSASNAQFFTNEPALLSSSCEALTFTLGGFSFSLPKSICSSAAQFESLHLVWVGRGIEHALLTNLKLLLPSNPFHHFDVASETLRRSVHEKMHQISRQLARRFYLMEAVKNASVIGILVGTLGVTHYLDVVAYLQQLCHKAGKKTYMILIGKLNEAKLANFSEIDLFVLIACPVATALVDTRGQVKQIVGSFETVAALRGTEWSGRIQTEFDKIIPRESLNKVDEVANSAMTPLPDMASPSSSSSASAAAAPQATLAPPTSQPLLAADDDLVHGVRFDPITGKLRSALPTHLEARGLSSRTVGGDSLVPLSSSVVSINAALQSLTTTETKTAWNHFAGRTFKGLDPTVQATSRSSDDEQASNDPAQAEQKPIAKIEQGLDGVARKYQ